MFIFLQMLARIFLNSLRKMDASRSSDPIVDSASMNALKLSLTRVSAQYILKASFSIGRSVFLARKGFRCQPQRHLDDDHAGCEEEHKQCGPPGRVQHQSFNYTLNRSVTRSASRCNDTTGAGVESSPAVSDGVVYVGSVDNTLYALDAHTWRASGQASTTPLAFPFPRGETTLVFSGGNEVDTQRPLSERSTPSAS